MENTSTRQRNICYSHSKNLLLFSNKKKMTIFLQFLSQCFTDTSAVIKSILEEARSIKLIAYAQFVKTWNFFWQESKRTGDIDIPTKCHDLLEKVSCKLITQAFFDRKCKLCPSLDTEAINDCETIAFSIWNKGDKYYENVLCEQTGEEIYNMLETQTDEIQERYYWKRI